MSTQGADANGAAAPGTAGLAARRAACDLLSAVLDGGALLSEAVASGEVGLDALAPSDRARAQRLATVTLRHLGPADHVLKKFLRKSPQPPVRNALRLATVELLALGTPAHAAVDGAVSSVRARRKTAHAAGLVNAVLRKVATGGSALWAEAPPQRLPGWLRGRLQSAYGRAVTEAIEAAHGEDPPLDLTAREEAAALAAATGGALLATGSVRLRGAVQVSALPGFDTGAFWVQDAAAALPAKALSPKSGERILDLCAAPGGKTLQLAAAGAQVTALDDSASRLERLEENLARTGLPVAIVTADALDWHAETPFDAVLLDAPCSATGTIRRHPDLPFVKSAADLKSLVALQAALFDRAVAALRPGGRLVYCTCSLLPEEGERIVEAALSRHPGLAPDPDAVLLPGVDPAWCDNGRLRLRPDCWADLGGLDGFFIAAFRKDGAPEPAGG